MYWLAFLTGFMGSLHCIGMCGPLALAVPLADNKRWKGLIFYNLGRTFTYTILGVVFGLAGFAIAMTGFQQKLSVSLGIILLLSALIPFVSVRIDKKLYGAKPVKLLKQKIALQFKKRTMMSAFAVGMLNGLLPCGLVFFAIAGAVVSGSIYAAGLYMITFSLGTFPAMMSLTFVRKWFPGGFRVKVSAILCVIIAFVMIYRGVALDIPQLSELMETAGLGKITSCGN